MRKATRWMVPIVPLVGLAMSITTSLSGVSRLHPPSEKQAGMLRVAEVMLLATREEILDLGVHYEHLLAARHIGFRLAGWKPCRGTHILLWRPERTRHGDMVLHNRTTWRSRSATSSRSEWVDDPGRRTREPSTR